MKVRLPLIAVIALVLGAVAAPVLAQAGAGITVTSSPMVVGKAIYADANHDGVQQPGELLGTYDVYNPQLYLNFYWTPIAGAAYYRVSLIQYQVPNVGPNGPSQEIGVAHHFAGDPNKTTFSMTVPPGACFDCVTVVHVVPESVAITHDANGATVYQYTDLPGGLTSLPFVLEFVPRPTPSGTGLSCPPCGDGVCTSRESTVAAGCWCPSDCGQP